MKNKKALAFTLSVCLLLSGISTGCAKNGSQTSMADSSTGGGKTNISLFNSKGEISNSLQSAAKKFNDSNKSGITISVTTLSGSATVDETMMTKYASGNPCTINMVDAPIGVQTYAAKSLDLSSEPWVKKINTNFVSVLKSGDKLIAFPFAVEGNGMIYNKTTIEKATGEKFDPSTIQSLSDLEALYKKIEAGGVAPVEISHEDWSMASHYLGTAYATQGPDYLKKLKEGTADISTNKTFNGLIKLLDLNKKYNIYKKSPMSSDYNTTDPKNIGTGKVAFWFNGVWVWPNVSQFLTGDHAKDEFGLLPLFADSKTTDSVTASVTKVLLVDSVKATDQQQKAAKEFLNWLASDPAGQKALVEDMDLIPAFTNITFSPDNGIAKSIQQYMKTNNTVPSANVSGDYQTEVGALMQQYLVGRINKATLAKSINSYFKSANWVK
jgi:raffinose/stachyose/melibiose transport system substrate-binding protein